MENYYFNAEGAYTGSAPAQPGTVAPENAIRVRPPEKDGFWPVVRPGRDGWDLAEDHRGREGWLSGQIVIIGELGPLPEGWSDTAQTDPAVADDSAQRFFLTRTGTYHGAGCSYTKAIGRWLTLPEIIAERPSAKPCGRCRPAGIGDASQ